MKGTVYKYDFIPHSVHPPADHVYIVLPVYPGHGFMKINGCFILSLFSIHFVALREMNSPVSTVKGFLPQFIKTS